MWEELGLAPLSRFVTLKADWALFLISIPMLNVFLSAEWRYLAMLNYIVDQATLLPRVPPGTELDSHEGVTYASVVGFRFCKTRVCGLPIPFHQNFDEVNLRFYVRHKENGEWKRGVVFVKEIVPRWAIAWVARSLYGEPYASMPMRHRIDHQPSALRVEYGWRRKGQWESVSAQAEGDPQAIASGSVEEFITEHYWGYTGRPKGTTEYQVEHPRWRVWHAPKCAFTADVATLYGPEFVESLSRPPVSAFIAEGSAVRVRQKSHLAPDVADSSAG